MCRLSATTTTSRGTVENRNLFFAILNVFMQQIYFLIFFGPYSIQGSNEDLHRQSRLHWLQSVRVVVAGVLRCTLQLCSRSPAGNFQHKV